jgi:SAM-dependent methyltransferase
VDFATSMIELLRVKCHESGLRNVESQVADGMALPFADADFDAGFSSFGLFLFSDRARGFSELLRVVKPQSKVAISSWTPAAGPIESMYGIVREILPDLPFQKGRAPLGTQQEIEEEMESAGFEGLQIEQVTVHFAFPSVAEFWAENSRASGPLVALRKKASPVEWAEVEARILATLRQVFPAAVQYDRDAWVAVGRKPAWQISV